jgi:hypothetical protein
MEIREGRRGRVASPGGLVVGGGGVGDGEIGEWRSGSAGWEQRNGRAGGEATGRRAGALAVAALRLGQWTSVRRGAGAGARRRGCGVGSGWSLPVLVPGYTNTTGRLFHYHFHFVMQCGVFLYFVQRGTTD